MDMTRFLRRSLTNEVLQDRQGMSYEGRVARVVEQRVFNKYKYTKDEHVLVFEFDDGWTWIPNQRALKDLTAALGTDSDAVVGRRIRVFLKAHTRTETGSGRAVEKLEKFVEVLDSHGEATW